jgi:hypothetical protein
MLVSLKSERLRALVYLSANFFAGFRITSSNKAQYITGSANESKNESVFERARDVRGGALNG